MARRPGGAALELAGMAALPLSTAANGTGRTPRGFSLLRRYRTCLRDEVDAVAGRDRLTDGSYGPSCALCRDPYIDHKGVQRPEPEVVGVPPRHFTKEVRLHASVNHGGRLEGVVALVMFDSAADLDLGQVSLAKAFVGDRMFA